MRYPVPEYDPGYHDWLSKKSSEFRNTNPKEGFESWMMKGFYETEGAWQARAEMHAEAQQRISKLEAEINDLDESLEARNKKLKSLSAHETCGCSYDSQEHVCMHHSPQLAEAKRRISELEQENAELSTHPYCCVHCQLNMTRDEARSHQCHKKPKGWATKHEIYID